MDAVILRKNPEQFSKRNIMKCTFIYLDENQTQAAVARRLLRLASVRRAPQSSSSESGSKSSILRLRFATGAAATGLAERDGWGEERGRRLVASSAMGSPSESASPSSSCVPDAHACVSPPWSPHACVSAGGPGSSAAAALPPCSFSSSGLICMVLGILSSAN